MSYAQGSDRVKGDTHKNLTIFFGIYNAPLGREAFELGLALTPVGHDSLEQVPEAGAMMREAQVAELVDDDVVDALDRGADEVQIEAQYAVDAHRTPTGLIPADDQGLGAFVVGDIELHHAAEEAFLE